MQGKTHGQKFLTKAGRLYKQKLIDLYASDEMELINVPMKVRIELFPPTTAQRDVDNYVKPVLDGLKFLEMIEDDRLITTIVVFKHEKCPEYNKGMALVYVKEDTKPNKDRSHKIKQFLEANDFDAECMLNFHVPPKKYVKKRDRKDADASIKDREVPQ